MRGRARAAVAATLLLSLTIVGQAQAAPTDPDPDFDADGLLTLHSATHDELLADMAVLPDGKVMLLTLTGTDPAMELYRLLPSGSPDPSFGGGDGVFAFAPAGNAEDVHLTVDPRSGKSYVSTFLDNGSTSPTTLWRIRADGTLDTSYGGSGTGHRVFNHRLVNGMQPLPHGRLLMAGDDLGAHDARVWRMANAGSPDRTFGRAGHVSLSAGNEANAVLTRPDGTIVVVGNHFNPTTSLLLVFQLKPNGRFDHTFSHDGRTKVDPSSTGVTTSTVWNPQVLLRPDGRLVVVGGLNQNDGAFRNSLLVGGLTVAGKPDPKFRTHVFRDLAWRSGEAALERDGKVVVTGFHANPETTNVVLRLTAKGKLDPTWASGGVLTLPEEFDLILDGITPHGRVLVGRTVGTTTFDAEVRALKGTPTPLCKGRLATQFGGSTADTLRGTAGRDVLVGLGGDDTLKGLGGQDVLCGNGGDDTLVGGPGRDTLFGGPGHNTLVP